MIDIHSRIIKPTLLLNPDRAKANIQKMVDKAQFNGVRLRPHFKTHQSAAIGEWFRRRGVSAITVSSVDMAYYFAAHGWHDITIAFPVNLRQMHALNGLAQTIRLNLVVESVEVVERMRPFLEANFDTWIKIDAGYHRTGLAWDEPEKVLSVARAVADTPNLNFKGLLTHAGHTYAAKSPADINHIYEQTTQRLGHLRQLLAETGFEIELSVGDTPACSIVEAFGDVDEIRPGNFVFYDVMQRQLGACKEDEIAVAVACPVVATHLERHEIVIYGGAIHLSKEAVPGDNGRPIFGHVAFLTDKGWSSVLPGAAVVSLSQEHGIIRAEPGLLEEVQVGDILAIIPVHSCLTANLFGWYLSTDGELIEMARFVGPF